MGLSHRRYPLHGVQFHPESFLTGHGAALAANFLRLAPVSPAASMSAAPVETPCSDASSTLRSSPCP